MKGLLHRLAARATGMAVTMRSDARLALGGVGSVHAADAVAGPPSTAETRPAVQSEPTSTTVREDASRNHPLSPIVGPPPSDLQSPRADPAGLDADARGHVDHALPDAAAVNLSVSAPPRPVEYAVDRDRVNQPRSDPPFASTDRSADPHPPESERPAGAVRIAREPPLLIPLPATDRRSAAAAITGTVTGPLGGAAQQSGWAEDRDVHIHIGSVEVTAVQEPAPPRRRPVSAGQPPMTLDAYLAKRSRG